jgi:hypothetical protein
VGTFDKRMRNPVSPNNSEVDGHFGGCIVAEDFVIEIDVCTQEEVDLESSNT